MNPAEFPMHRLSPYFHPRWLPPNLSYYEWWESPLPPVPRSLGTDYAYSYKPHLPWYGNYKFVLYGKQAHGTYIPILYIHSPNLLQISPPSGKNTMNLSLIQNESNHRTPLLSHLSLLRQSVAFHNVWISGSHCILMSLRQAFVYHLQIQSLPNTARGHIVSPLTSPMPLADHRNNSLPILLYPVL